MFKKETARKRDPEFQDFLRERLSVDETTGVLKFRDMYTSLCVNVGWKSQIIVIPYSHLSWFAKHGNWPQVGMQLDHINDDPTDNRPINLQEISEAENQKKRRGRLVYRSYGKGRYGHGINIYHDKRDNRFYVTRQLSRGHSEGRTVKKSLGGFDFLPEAEAYVKKIYVEIDQSSPDHIPGANPKKSKISVSVVNRMKKLRERGLTLEAIATKTGFSVATVYNKTKT